jgi:radical SAM superfamily enzyme YgiQ (UPF0313 family)
MKKIIFVNLPNFPFTPQELLIEPIDLLSLASFIIQSGYKAEVLDMDIERLELSALPQQVKTRNGDIVVILCDYHIPLHTDLVMNGLKAVTTVLVNLGIKVVYGGKVATYSPEKVLIDGCQVIAVQREMEVSLLSLLSLQRWTVEALRVIPQICFYYNSELTKTGKIDYNFDINSLPIPDRRLVNIDNYIDIRSLLSSRGCVHECSYCNTCDFWGSWRGRKADMVVAEIDHLINELEAKKILFLDDNAIVDNTRMVYIAEKIIKKNIQVKLGCLGSIRFADKKMLELMVTAGWRWIHYGVESGDDEVLRKTNKGVSSRKIEEILEYSARLGLRVRSSWILDLPGMTEESLKRTVELIMKSQTPEIRLHYLSLRPGSEFYGEYRNKVSSIKSYIHNPVSNYNLTKIEPERFNEIVNDMIKGLMMSGYIMNTDENLQKIIRTPTAKVVSLKPLRYGLHW